MPTPNCKRVVLLTLLAAAYGAAAHAQAPAQLPVGKTIAGQTSDAAPAVFRFTAPAAGVLSVAARSDQDISIAVLDVDGQTVPDGSADRDLFGGTGNEQLAVTLTEPGEYRVQIQLVSGSSAKFEIGAGWIAMPGFARTGDPDRRPTMATDLEIGQSREDSLDTDAGDAWDWFRVTPKSAGTLTVILRSVNDSSPDLAVEVYSAKDFATHIVRSDDDLQGNHTNESASIDVVAGEPVYVKVVSAIGSADGAYRIASSLIQ